MTQTMAARGGLVLILEDDQIQAIDLAEIVKALGHEVLGPFSLPDEALGAIAAERPDWALLDMSLSGGRTSLPVADALATAGVPFAFVTGRADALPAWLDRHGDRLLLVKPFRPSQVATLLDRLQEQAGAAR